MGWAGVPVYLTMAVLPVILVSMGLADEIHVFTRYRQHRDSMPGASVAELTRLAMDEMCLPIVATALTTAIGFLSFAISPLGPVQAFGLFTAIGIVFCMFWTLTVIPAMIVKLAPGGVAAPRTSRRPDPVPGGAAWRSLASAIRRRPYATLALALLGLAL